MGFVVFLLFLFVVGFSFFCGRLLFLLSGGVVLLLFPYRFGCVQGERGVNLVLFIP